MITLNKKVENLIMLNRKGGLINDSTRMARRKQCIGARYLE